MDLDVDRGWRELDPTQRRRRIIDAIAALLLAASREGPVLVVLEDLQWIDPETHAILDELMKNLSFPRVSCFSLPTAPNIQTHGSPKTSAARWPYGP